MNVIKIDVLVGYLFFKHLVPISTLTVEKIYIFLIFLYRFCYYDSHFDVFSCFFDYV